MSDNNIEFTVSAPGKIILSGEHSVVYHGNPAIAASISKRSYCTIKRTNDSNITIVLKSYNYLHTISLKQFEELVTQSLNIAKRGFNLKHIDQVSTMDLADLKSTNRYKVSNESQSDMSSEDPRTLQIENAIFLIKFLLHAMFYSIDVNLTQGFNLIVQTELVIGAGSGSSASFSVCIAASIYNFIKHCIKEKYSNETQRNVSKNGFAHCLIDLKDLSTFTKEDKEIINNWAFIGEKITHGKPSGLDNTICTHGSVVVMTRYPDQNKIKVVNDKIYELNILLIDTGVSRSTATLVQKVSDLKARHDDVVSQVLKSIGEVTRSVLNNLKTLASIEEDMIDERFKELEELIDINQCLLESLGVSHPSLDKIINICKTFNLHAKLTGAGGGGYAFAIIPPNYQKDKIHQCILTLQNEGFNVFNDIKLGGVGLQLDVTSPLINN